MKTHPSLFAVALLAAAWLIVAPAVAADDAASFSTSQPAPGVPWTRLTPEQQTVLQPYRERWTSRRARSKIVAVKAAGVTLRPSRMRVWTSAGGRSDGSSRT